LRHEKRRPARQERGYNLKGKKGTLRGRPPEFRRREDAGQEGSRYGFLEKKVPGGGKRKARGISQENGRSWMKKGKGIFLGESKSAPLRKEL